jgi:DNA invertase Pin-like site-specific DNA recombinase
VLVVDREYVDRESRRKGIAKRKRFNELFEDASRRKFDFVLFWALDRISRRAWSRRQLPATPERLWGRLPQLHICRLTTSLRNVLLAVMSSLGQG